MTSFVPPTAADHPSGGSVPAVYLGLYLVLLAFFVYFVAVNAAERRAVTPADEIADLARAVEPVTAREPEPALRPLIEALRPLALPGGAEDRSEPDRLAAVVPAHRIFIDNGARLRPEFVAVLDRVARELTRAAADGAVAAEGQRASTAPRLDLQLLVGLAAENGSGNEPPSVAQLLAERLAIARAAALARALLARGTPPDSFAVGVAPGAGTAVRFRFRLDQPHVVRENDG